MMKKLLVGLCIFVLGNSLLFAQALQTDKALEGLDDFVAQVLEEFHVPGLAIAIVLSIPNELPGKNMLLDLTLGVVVFTLLINAPTIRPLITWLGINRLSEQEEEELKQGVNLARDRSHRVLTRLFDAGLLSRGNLYRLEQQIEQTLGVLAKHLSSE